MWWGGGGVFEEKQRRLFDVVDVDELVRDGVDGKCDGGVDVEFASDVASVSEDGVDGDVQLVGYFLIGEAAYYAADYLLLAFGEGVGGVVGGVGVVALKFVD